MKTIFDSVYGASKEASKQVFENVRNNIAKDLGESKVPDLKKDQASWIKDLLEGARFGNYAVEPID